MRGKAENERQGADDAQPRIDGHGIHFSYRGRPVLSGATLGAGAGEIVSLLGANGAGKSTLLRILLGLLRPDRGEILLDGTPLTSLTRRKIARSLAYVPQVHVSPFPYTVREVIMLGRLAVSGLFNQPSARDSEIVAGVLNRLGMEHAADRSYTEVSGGERQLTLIGRALAQESKVLVMDEPMASLDFGYRTALARHLRELGADGRAIIISTHDPHFAMHVSTRVALLAAGRIEADGPPEETLTAAAIRRLYGVEVESFALPSGHQAFFPAGTRTAEPPARIALPATSFLKPVPPRGEDPQ
jgi:iron complex transport system ATP-binding protein